MQSLLPTFVTCTWGAGGSTFEKTTELSAVAQTVHGLETCMHLTCTNMDRGKVDDALAVCGFFPLLAHANMTKRLSNNGEGRPQKPVQIYVQVQNDVSDSRTSDYFLCSLNLNRRPSVPAFKTFWHFVETHLAGKSTGHTSTIPLCMPLTLSDTFASSMGNTFASELQVWAH